MDYKEQNGLFITHDVFIPEHELIITTSRAGGPGGQHVNKTDTRITIKWHIATSTALSEQQKTWLLHRLQTKLTDEGFIIVQNSSTRSQLQNKKLAYEQLTQLIAKALHRPKKRIKTKVSAQAKEKRLKTKKIRSETKRLRRIDND